jgi:hypothetical protein
LNLGKRRFSRRKFPREPIVIEVTVDVAWSGRSFRHPLRFIRARSELDPDDVEFPAYLPPF